MLLQLVHPPLEVAVHAIDARERRFCAAAAFFQARQGCGNTGCLLLRFFALPAQLFHILLQLGQLALSRRMFAFQARYLFALGLDGRLANIAQVFVTLALHHPVVQAPFQPAHFGVHLTQRRALVRAFLFCIAPLFTEPFRLGYQFAQQAGEGSGGDFRTAQLGFDRVQPLLRFAQLALQRQRTLRPGLAPGDGDVVKALARRGQEEGVGVFQSEGLCRLRIGGDKSIAQLGQNHFQRPAKAIQHADTVFEALYARPAVLGFQTVSGK